MSRNPREEPGLCPDGDCGLFVVARLAGLSIMTTRERLGPQDPKGGYTIPRLSAFLGDYGMMLGLGIDWTHFSVAPDPFEPNITMEVSLKDINEFVITVNSGRHVVLWRDGVVYDPALGYPPELGNYDIRHIWPVVHHEEV